MLNKFSVTNYLSFKDTNTIDFTTTENYTDLKENTFKKGDVRYHKVMGVFGYNASGKSNLLKAIMFVRQFVLNSALTSVSTNKIPVQPFKLSDSTDSFSTFEIELKIGDQTYIYGFQADEDKIAKEWLKQKKYNKTLFIRKNNEITKVNKDFKETKTVRTPIKSNALLISLLAVSNTPIATAIADEMKQIEIVLNSDKGVVLDYTFNNFAKNEEYREAIKGFVLEADINIQDVKALEKPVSAEEYTQKVPPMFRNLIAGTPGNFFERQLTTTHNVYDSKGKIVKEVDFNFFDESFGTQQFFALSGVVVNAIKDGKMVFIDELDSSLHSFLTKYIIKYFVSREHNPKNARLFFTTHDTNILSREILRRDQILFVDKNKLGESEVYTLAELGERKDRNYEERYLDGRYGAIPFIQELEK